MPLCSAWIDEADLALCLDGVTSFDPDVVNCEVVYRARYWGKVQDVVMSTEWGAVA